MVNARLEWGFLVLFGVLGAYVLDGCVG